MNTGTLRIHSENILPIIKKWLYSEKDIFVRELVSNACDAIRKLTILSNQDLVKTDSSEWRIDIKIDKEARTLQFSDTGIGMTASEVENYIAQIAFSGAEEFMSKYQSQDEKDQIIGHFGLGFYSAYMVADRVTIDTLSFTDSSEPVFWSCDGSSQYEIGKGTRQTRGTDIVLHIGRDHDECLDVAHIRKIILHYCSFLPYPIYLNGEHLNHTDPLWLKNSQECTDKEYLEFYRQLYPMQEDPLFWLHINVDYPFHCKGILYFPRAKSGVDYKKNHIKLFCNRVFVSDNCQELIPDYLMLLQGAIDSPDIPLNVSRSYLQMDRTVRQLGVHISKKVAEKLTGMFKSERENFIEQWPSMEVIVKIGVLQDEKFFERIKEILGWKNSEGEWVTLDEYLAKHREDYKDKVFYANDLKQQGQFIEMYRKKGIEVLLTDSLIDAALMSFLENKQQPAIKFQRIDGAVEDLIIDSTKEQVILDQEGKTEASRLASFVKGALQLPKLEVEAKSLASDDVAGFVMIDEQERRMRDYMRLHQPEMRMDDMFRPKHTFIVNTNSKLVQAIKTLSEKDGDLAKDMLLQVYQLALMSQQEVDPATLSNFISQSTKVLEKLALRAS